MVFPWVPVIAGLVTVLANTKAVQQPETRTIGEAKTREQHKCHEQTIPQPSAGDVDQETAAPTHSHKKSIRIHNSECLATKVRRGPTGRRLMQQPAPPKPSVTIKQNKRIQVQTRLSQRPNSIPPGLRRFGCALLGVGIPRIPKPSIA